MPTATEQLVTSILAGILKQSGDSLAPAISFADLGLDSLSGIRLVAAIEASLSLELDPMIVLDFPSITSLAARVDELAREPCHGSQFTNE